MNEQIMQPPMISPTNAGYINHQVKASTLNLTTNEDAAAGEAVSQLLLDMSNLNNSILPPTPTNNQLGMSLPKHSQQSVPHTSGRKESCTSPKTARFNSMHGGVGQLLKQSKRQQQKEMLDISNISRENIKQNTKNLISEISDLDTEIAVLQGTLLTSLQPHISASNTVEDNLDNIGMHMMVEQSNVSTRRVGNEMMQRDDISSEEEEMMYGDE